MTDIRTDFCVVGAGPAGLTLALLLLRSGCRVTVIERSRSLDRDFRGEILQPGGMTLLDDLGVLQGARERGCHEHDRFLLMEGERVLVDGDYRRLPGPHNCLLSLPQAHLLAELLDRCGKHEGFDYREGSRAGGLIERDGRIEGVTATGDDGPLTVRAHCVVGADGRYSKVRRLAGIDAGRLDVFDQDVLWFRIPAHGQLPPEVRIARGAGEPILAYGSMPDHIQFGWTLPHGGYKQLAAQGFEHILDRICAATPGHADRIREHVRSLRDLSLLDVFSGSAERWVADGLVLIGDSAHTHSPIGAQGINLAVQDAVALHPVLIESLRTRDASAAMLDRYASPRRSDIAAMMRIQVVQSRGMLSTGRIAGLLRPRLAPLLSRSPIYRRMLDRIAFGNRAIRVRHDLFTTDAATWG